MTVDLSGKVMLISGGYGAIGRECALSFARNGSHVIIVDYNIPVSSTLIEEIERFGVKALSICGDVRLRSDMLKVAETVKEKFGKVDILINNAGVNVPKEKRAYVHEFDDDEWDRVLSVDLDGVYNCSKHLIKLMVEKKYGKIINISSIVGLVPLRNQNAFAAAKAGVVNLSKAWAVELAEFNINVNVVAPGSIICEGTRELFYGDKNVAKAMLSHIPMGRPGVPEDVANAVLFLASDISNYITGNVLTVDGGWICGYSRDF